MQASPRTSDNFWTTSSISFKLYLIITTILFIIGIFIPDWYIYYLLDNPYLTIYSHSYYKIFISFLGTTPKLISIISIGLSFLWLHKLLKDSEQSTIYKIIEIILINFQIHLLFNIIFIITLLIFTQINQQILYGYGWFNIIIVYQFRQSIINPDTDRYFCFIPFSIKGKYYPYVVLIVILALSQQVLCLIATIIVGVYQEVYKKEMLIRLPFGFYAMLEKIVPGFIKSRYDYTPISKNKQQIRSKCLFGSDLPQDDNPIFTEGDAIELGGRYKKHANGYKQYWEYRNNQMEVDSVEIYKQMEEKERQKEKQRQKAYAEWLEEQRKRQIQIIRKEEEEKMKNIQEELQEGMKNQKKGRKNNRLKQQLIYD